MACEHPDWTPTLEVQSHPLGGGVTPGVYQLHLQVQCATCAAPLTFSLPPASDLLYQEAAMLPGAQTVRLSARVLASVGDAPVVESA